MIVYTVKYTDSDTQDLTVSYKATQADALSLVREIKKTGFHPSTGVRVDLEDPVQAEPIEVPTSNGRQSLCDFLNQQFEWSYGRASA